MIHDPGTKNNVQNQVANSIRGRTSTFEGESDTCDGEVVVRDGPQDGGLEHVGSGHVTSENLSMRLSSGRNSYSLCISMYMIISMPLYVYVYGNLTSSLEMNWFAEYGGTSIYMAFCRIYIAGHCISVHAP